jgi:AraC-like DNA-binding protein
VQSGNDLTTAAAEAGFADAAHFTRTFRATFGMAPSVVLPLISVVEVNQTSG